MAWTVEKICTGKSAPLGNGKPSAIAKSEVAGPVAFTRLRMGNDEQVNLVHHGGPDMAVHLYPQDHCDWWLDRTQDPVLADASAFGSNLVLRGLLENQVCIGARYRLGNALLEACQPRQPCATIEARFARKGMVMEILASGRCGFFFRVIEEGEAQAGDTMVQLSSGDERWTMARMFSVLWGKEAKRALEQRRELASHPLLPKKLRRKIG